MTRRRVARENAEPFPGTFLAPGCLSAGSDILPVVYDFVTPDLFGQARDFERDKETGAISFDIEINSDFEPIDENFGVYATNLVEYHTNDTRIVLEAVIRQIMFLPQPGYPRSHKTQAP